MNERDTRMSHVHQVSGPCVLSIMSSAMWFAKHQTPAGFF